MLLIYGDEATAPQDGSPEGAQMFAEYGAFTQEVMQAGAMQSGEPLLPIATATTVRVRSGKTLTTDGPFAETKEQLGGFYIVDCKDLDAAIGWAAKIPGAKHGSIEVRPIMEMSMPATT
jgi:hypothetical protein